MKDSSTTDTNILENIESKVQNEHIYAMGEQRVKYENQWSVLEKLIMNDVIIMTL